MTVSFVGGYPQPCDILLIKFQAFVMQNRYTLNTQYAAMVTHDTRTRSTTGFIHGFDLEEMAMFKERVIASRHLMNMPTLLPFLLLSTKGASVTARMDECLRRIVDIEESTGIRSSLFLTKSGCSHEVSLLSHVPLAFKACFCVWFLVLLS